MIASGSSKRALSEVAITRSASRLAISPIGRRLPRSRSPPQPNTTISLLLVSTRAAFRTLSSESGVWAWSTTTANGWPMSTVSKRPGTWPAVAIARAHASAETPSA